MQVIGRNDDCICGSGRKFKYCCGKVVPSEQSGVEPAEPEEQLMSELKQALMGQDFRSGEEVEAFAEQFFNKQVHVPIDDFHGLSAQQMDGLLYAPFEVPHLVEFADRIDSSVDGPFMSLFGMLAEAITTDRLKPTAIGNLPPKICQDIARVHLNEKTFPYDKWFMPVKKEGDFFDLHVVRLISEISGFVRKYKKHFILSRDCRARMDDGGLGALFPSIFKTYARTFSWAYRDGFVELDIIQRSFLFTLFLLAKYGEDWRPSIFYEDQFLRAFPTVLREFQEGGYQTPEERVRTVYTHRALVNFAGFLGLAKVELMGSEGLIDEYRIRRTPLLDELVSFHI